MIRETEDGLKWECTGHADHMGPVHEDFLDKRLLALVPAGGVFLDVGAHVGHYTLRAARGASKVIAIEANPETYARLEWNLSLNNITNVIAYNVAAWDSTTQLRLHSPNGMPRDGSMRVLEADGGPWTYAAPLDRVLEDEPRIDVVKLDVEGADLHALRGMERLVRKHRPVMVIEDHSVYGYYAAADLPLTVNVIYDGGVVIEPFGPGGHTPYLLVRPRLCGSCGTATARL